MANELQNVLDEIKLDKDTNLLPENLKAGVTCLGINGTFEGSIINNQDKTITSNGTYQADEGYTGLGQVTVNVPQSGGSDNSGLIVNIDEDSFQVSNVDGVAFGFTLNENGYYESTNKGSDDPDNDYTASVCKVTFNALIDNARLVLDCISYAESSCDYGILYKLDTDIGYGYSDDTSGDKVLYSFSNNNSPSVTPKAYENIPKGTHYFYVKYRKDGSASKNNDSFQFKFNVDKNTEFKKAVFYDTVEIMNNDTTQAKDTFGLIYNKDNEFKDTYKYDGTNWNICPPEHWDSRDANATGDDILIGKTAYVNGEKISGLIADYAGTDWTNNNFEISDNKLLIKKTFATIGFNGKTDLQGIFDLPLPLEVATAIKANKDNVILYYYMNMYNSYSTLNVFIPNDGQKILCACASSVYNMKTLTAPINITSDKFAEYTYFVATDTNGNCYDNTNHPDISFTQYSISYSSPTAAKPIPSVSSTNSSVDHYESTVRLYEDSTVYKSFICLGLDTLATNMNNVDEMFKFMDWSTHNDTIFGVSITDIETTFDTISVSNEELNNTSSVDVHLDEAQTETYNNMDGTVIHILNPNGTGTKALSDYNMLFKPFIRKIPLANGSYGILGFNGIINADIDDNYLSVGTIYGYDGSSLDSYGYSDNQASLCPAFTMTNPDGSWDDLADKSANYNNWDIDYIGFYRTFNKNITAAQFKIDTDVYISNQYMPY